MNTPTDRHGSPQDRGSADKYYQRPFRPHYFMGATYRTPEVTIEAMTPAEVEAYREGYEQETDQKEWGICYEIV